LFSGAPAEPALALACQCFLCDQNPEDSVAENLGSVEAITMLLKRFLTRLKKVSLPTVKLHLMIIDSTRKR
jgi:hypothetical protein